jgi:DNA-binding transcriptional LysR family regulator
VDIQFLNGGKMLSTDRLDLLKLFVRTAEFGKISGAADAVGISQPTASRLLRTLETLLEVKLCQRVPSGVKITPSGQEMLGPARLVLRQWDLIAHSTSSHGRRLSGHIRIAVSVAVGESVLAMLVARFIKQHSAVTVDCDLRDDQVDLSTSEYDLWFKAGQIKSDQLVVREITSVRRGIFCSPALGSMQHPNGLQTMKAIRLTPFVSESIRLTNEETETYLLRQNCAMTTNNLYAARSAAIEGVGYAVLPLWITRLDIERGKLIQTCASWQPEPVSFSLAYMPTRNQPARIVAITKYLQQELSDATNLRKAFLNRLQIQDD